MGLMLIISLTALADFSISFDPVTTGASGAPLQPGYEVTEYRVKCANQTGGPYTDMMVLQTPTGTVVASEYLSWYCVVTAVNQVGESLPSNEVMVAGLSIPEVPAKPENVQASEAF